jgi:dipeptidyl aminopeptidase/acylaminoacyl peptidase
MRSSSTPEDEGHVRLYTLALDGGTPIPQNSTGSNHGPRVGIDCYWHRTESMHMPPEVAFTCGGHTSVVSQFNTELLAELDLRPAEELRFTGANDVLIQAYVVTPPDFDSNRKWPLLHNVHSGPHKGVMDDWHWRWNPTRDGDSQLRRGVCQLPRILVLRRCLHEEHPWCMGRRAIP